ncbi:helix-turn-helix domain-containing protein [Lutimaribacter marinistellae]|uniref:Helix-turn-helix domain-containing protein n=1 Tax=Lutimaribacter marinistellae TaxID=1820329 RepID=A0ABV7TE73_9RHOB
MPRDTLTGSRIRERRLIAGLRQADLAREAGISASYLNLIEHNRRRIGGKLLVDIAGVLGVEPSMLTEGAGAALISTLREAAADAEGVPAETDRVDELAGRFPGWAELLGNMHRRIVSLERTVQTLSDRLTHDPHLANSLHEVLSTAAAIRSTAAILAEPGELDAEWRNRFHGNLHQDAERLAESSKALVAYLDDSDAHEERRGNPQEQVESFFASHNHHFPMIEETGDPDAVPLDPVGSSAAKTIGRAVLSAYAADAKAMPLEMLTMELEKAPLDPMALARHFDVDLPTVFRRLATLPDGILDRPVGLVVCDASGSVLFRKSLPGFAMPRHGESCPLWPLFSALNRPLVPLRRRVTQLGRTQAAFDCLAIAWPQDIPDFDRDPIYRSIMLILPVSADEQGTQTALPVGTTCRLCPSGDCAARREPSILGEGF